MATVSLLGILLAMATGGLTYYFSARALETSAREITTGIREAQAMAVATGNTYRIDFSNSDGRSYTLQRRQGSSYITVRGPIALESGIIFSPSSPPAFGSEPYYLDFYARGTCESGGLVLKDRFGKTSSVEVDGETANVRVS